MEQLVTTPKVRELSVAFHEAGHVAAHLVFQIPFVAVTIDATGLYEGRVYSKEVWIPPKDAPAQSLRNDSYTNHLITLKLAGPASRAKYTGSTTADPADYTDLTHALTIIDQLFTGSEEASRQAFIEFKIKEAFDFVSGKDTWPLIALIARHLYKKNTLSHAECLALFSRAKPVHHKASTSTL